MTITTASLVAIIEKINEEITAVTNSTINHVITIVQDSIHEDCTWYGNPVTYDDIHAVVIDWIDENVEAPAAEVVEARIVEDVDASYDDDAIDEALDGGRIDFDPMMSKDFSEMTVEELRAYAEMVQAEYEADEISGPSGRQIVRDAWARVEEAERIEQMRAVASTDARRFCYVQCQKYASMFAQAHAQRDLAKAERALVALGHYVKNYKRLSGR